MIAGNREFSPPSFGGLVQLMSQQYKLGSIIEPSVEVEGEIRTSENTVDGSLKSGDHQLRIPGGCLGFQPSTVW